MLFLETSCDMAPGSWEGLIGRGGVVERGEI